MYRGGWHREQVGSLAGYHECVGQQTLDGTDTTDRYERSRELVDEVLLGQEAPLVKEPNERSLQWGGER